MKDYLTEDDERLLSAIRNLHAGVLLLFKEKLRRLSPNGSGDVLVMEKIVPFLDSSGNVSFKGTGRKTAEVQTIKDRFTALGIKVDWRRFERVSSERNSVEHFYPKATRETIRELLAEGCLLVREFIESALQEKPVDVLGPECWSTLLEVSSVADQERQACAAAIAEVKWDHDLLGVLAREFTCTDCGSSFMRPKDTSSVLHDLEFVCRSCGSEPVFIDQLEELVYQHFRWEIHEAGKGGTGSPVGRCPECGQETFIAAEWTCIACGHEPEESRCWRCHAALDLEELDLNGLCSWCEHMTNKED